MTTLAPVAQRPANATQRGIPDSSARRSHPRRGRWVALAYPVLVVLAVGFVIPWVWMISTSLKSADELALWPPRWIPQRLRFDNYVTVFAQVPFLRYLWNSTVITSLSVIGAVVSNTIAGYGFGFLRWRGRDTLFGVVLVTLIMPSFVTFIPLYVIYSQLGWINTYLPLVVPTFLGNAFFIFMMRQFFSRIPTEFADSARVDGASEFRIFASIALPLVRPAAVVVALLQFIGSWNDYFGPLIYLNDQQSYTIALGIAAMQSTYGFSNFAWIMAATAMSLLPVVVVFFVAQRAFVEGVTFTGLKG